MLLDRGIITGSVACSGVDDLGRWCWKSYKCSDDRQLTVISAYQVCDQPPVHEIGLRRTTKKYSA
jgi:hypothetical protein